MKFPDPDPDLDLDPYIQFDNFFTGRDKQGVFCDELEFEYIKPYYIHIVPVSSAVESGDSFVGSYDIVVTNRILKYTQVDCPAVFPKELEPYILSLPGHRGFTEKLNKDTVHYFTYLAY